MRGAMPKPEDQRVRPRQGNNAPFPTVHVTPDDEVRGPELPPGVAWSDATKSWWETWRRSPNAQLWVGTDWDFLLDTALIHNEVWSNGKTNLMAELRQRVAKFGATPEDRLRLRIAVERPGAVPPREDRALQAERRQRVMKAVDER